MQTLIEEILKSTPQTCALDSSVCKPYSVVVIRNGLIVWWKVGLGLCGEFSHKESVDCKIEYKLLRWVGL